jgi:hypothetical protein
MRSPQQWDMWLAEYDKASTEAETCQVSELLHINAVTNDFTDAVKNAAPIWSTNFRDTGRFAAHMDRKVMIQRFRGHMMTSYPLRSGWQRASIPDDVTISAEGSATTESNEDAHQSNRTTPESNQIRRYYRRTATTTLKRPSDQLPAITGGARCLACGQRRNIRGCYYADPDKAPAWWKPNETINELIQFKRENDATFQGLIRGKSRTCSQTPIIKRSHTPTPEILEERPV